MVQTRIYRLAALLTSLALIGAAPREKAADRAPVDAPDPYGSLYVPLPRSDVLITNARILDGAGQSIERGWVHIRSGTIVGTGSGASAPVDGARVIDARGQWLTPGIIDIHSHNGTYVAPLTANDSSYSDVSEVSSPVAAGVWVEHGINVQDPAFSRALENGVTTLHVMPGSIPLVGGRSVVLKNVPATYVQQKKFPGAVHGVKLSCGDNSRAFFGSKGGAPNSRMGAIEMLRDLFSRSGGRRGGGRRGPGGPPGDMDSATIAGVLDGELPVHVHCYRADDMVNMLNLAKEFGFKIAAVHHATEAYKIADVLVANGTCAAVWSDWWGFKTEAADAIRANAAFVDAAGGCVAMHSDSPLMGQRLNLEAAKAMASGRRAGSPIAPERAIRWITSNPAKVLGIGERVGTIAAGRGADLVLWSGDPFSVYSKAELVFIDGAIAFDRSDARRQPNSDFAVGRPTAGVQ